CGSGGHREVGTSRGSAGVVPATDAGDRRGRPRRRAGMDRARGSAGVVPRNRCRGSARAASPPSRNGYRVARAGVAPATFHFSGERFSLLGYLALDWVLPHCCGSPAAATPTGLQPATFAVTGRRANQLRHGALLSTGPTVVRAKL